MMKNTFILSLILLVISSNVFGLTNGDISYTLLSGDKLFTDQNKCDTEGPKANYIQVKITNLSGVAQTNLGVTLSSFSNHTNFSLTGGQAATQTLNNLPINGSDTVYWLIKYPSCDKNLSSNITLVTKNKNDNTTATGLLKNPNNSTAELAIGDLISANPTGQSSPLLVTRNDMVVGGIIRFKARYDFNTVDNGAGFWFQPVGNLDFNAAANQLVDVRICQYVDPKFVPCVLPQTTPLNYQCKMYYVATCKVNGNSNKYFYVEYDFRINSLDSTFAAPYAAGLSGNPYKYTYDPTNYKVKLNSVPPTSTPLPVSLASFEVRTGEIGNILSWTTSNEKNNQKFLIERSFDGNLFEVVSEIAAVGNATASNSYQFVDESKPNFACYRLLNQDINGQVFEHPSKCVGLTSSGLTLLSLYPNPTQKEITVSFLPSASSEEITLMIFDSQGRKVHQQTENTQEGANNVLISLENYASGLYFVKVSDGINTSSMYKFLKDGK